MICGLFNTFYGTEIFGGKVDYCIGPGLRGMNFIPLKPPHPDELRYASTLITSEKTTHPTGIKS